jgi:hypothetical protein
MQRAYLKASNPDAGDAFGFRVAMSADGTTVVLTASGEKSNAKGVDGNQADNSLSRPGAAYVFAKSGASWVQQAYLKASNTGDDFVFGGSVSIAGDGNTIAIGSEAETGGSTGVNGAQTGDATAFRTAGAVYVFARSGGKWTQQAYLKASNTGPQDMFGGAVSLSGDGNWLAVGAYRDDSNSAGADGDDKNEAAFDSGAVFIFRRGAGTWRQANYIKASNPGVEDGFGVGLALSADGNVLAVGAPNEDSAARGVNGNQSDDTAMSSGAVYVFARDGASWKQQAYLKASNADAGDAFGWNLSLSATGTTLAVAALFEAGAGTGLDADSASNAAAEAGAVYLFERSGSTWTQSEYVKASNAEAGDRFGFSLALSGDGRTLAVGARAEDSAAKGVDGDQASNAVMQSGAAYVFLRDDAGGWAQDAYLKASNTAAGDGFGTWIGMQEDGKALLISASSEASSAMGVDGNQDDRAAPSAGAAYVFTR